MLGFVALACGVVILLCGALIGGTSVRRALHHREYQAMLARTAALEIDLGLTEPASRAPTIQATIRRYGNIKPIRCDCPSNVKGCGYYGCPRRGQRG